jgi:hypothetical protein
VMAKYLSSTPTDLKSWIELAAIRMAMNRKDTALAALQTAVKKGGEPIRNLLRKDVRFKPLWTDPRFKTLVPPAATKRLPFSSVPKPAGSGGLSF